jgi:hypothetical protein
MKQKIIAPQEYNNLPRSVKRMLDRQAKKEGRDPLPDKIPEKVKIYSLVDKHLWTRGLKILEQNHIPVEKFINSALNQLILAEKQAKQSKLQ